MIYVKKNKQTVISKMLPELINVFSKFSVYKVNILSINGQDLKISNIYYSTKIMRHINIINMCKVSIMKSHAVLKESIVDLNS